MRSVFLTAIATASAALVVLASGAAKGISLPNPAASSIPLPAPCLTAFSTSVRYGPDGLLYAWDGQQVWRQNSVNGAGFTSIGTVSTGGADAGPINFSQDGGTLVISDGAGGFDANSNGLIYTLPSGGGATSKPAGTVPYNVDLVPVPTISAMPSVTAKMYVDHGFDFSGSSSAVDVFDFNSGAAQTVVGNIPGGSASLALDSQNRLYVDVGSGSARGQIRRFTTAQLNTALGSSTPLNFSAGELFSAVDNNSGSGMFFDKRGALFVGGPDGVTVFNSAGVGQFYNTGASSFPTVMYNATNDQLAVIPFGSAASIYNAVDFRVPVSWTVNGSGAWSDGTKWNTLSAPSGVDQVVALPGTTTAPATISLSAPITLGVLTFDGDQKYTISGASSLTMQASSASATLAANSGQHEITAPVVLASTTDVDVAGTTDQLTLSGAVSGAAGLNKIGAGMLVVQGANTYSGDTSVNAGTLQFAVISGVPSVAPGATVTIAEGATLELAGSVSALGVTGGVKAHIQNESPSGGLVVSAGDQVVGAVDGAGVTSVAADSHLTVDHIIQSALVIDGAPGHPGILTIAPSSNGDTGVAVSQFASNLSTRLLERRLITRSSIADGSELIVTGPSQAIPAVSSSLHAEPSGDLAIVPEPSTVALALFGSAVLATALLRRRRRSNRRSTAKHSHDLSHFGRVKCSGSGRVDVALAG